MVPFDVSTDDYRPMLSTRPPTLLPQAACGSLNWTATRTGLTAASTGTPAWETRKGQAATSTTTTVQAQHRATMAATSRASLRPRDPHFPRHPLTPGGCRRCISKAWSGSGTDELLILMTYVPGVTCPAEYRDVKDANECQRLAIQYGAFLRVPEHITALSIRSSRPARNSAAGHTFEGKLTEDGNWIHGYALHPSHARALPMQMTPSTSECRLL